jgi:hypothetical protein
MQCVPNEYRFDKSKAVIAVAEGFWIDLSRGHPGRYAENERAMSDALTKWLCFAPLGVHMVRIEVAGLASMKYDIRLCDGSAERLST